MRVKNDSSMYIDCQSALHILYFVVVGKSLKPCFENLNYKYEGGARKRKVLIFCAKSIVSSNE